MEIDLLRTILFLVTTITAVAVSFYVKDFLQTRNEYKKLRKKLEKVAGKKAEILYSGPGVGAGQTFTISEIDNHGITIENELQAIFVPAKKLLQSEMVVPCKSYEDKKLEKMKRDTEQFMDTMLPAMFDRIFPAMVSAMEEHFQEELMNDRGGVSAIIGVKIQKVLSEEGFEIKKLSSE